MKAKILWVEGKRADSPSFVPDLRRKGFIIEVVPTGNAAQAGLSEAGADLVVINAASLRSSGKRICQGIRSEWPKLPILVIAGMTASGFLAVVVERIAYRPLRNAPRLVPLLSAIGVSFVLQDAIRFMESIWRNAFYLTYPPLQGLDRRIQIGSTFDISVKSLVVIGSSILMLAALSFLVNKTKMGRAIRAVAQDPQTASLMGVDVNQVVSLTFLIGGAMGGAAGVLFGIQYTLISPYTGFIPGIKAFTAAVLGGIGNIPGAMVGGLVLGLLESFSASYLSLLTGGAFGAEYKDIFSFLILILILILRPKGLLGEVVGEKA